MLPPMFFNTNPTIGKKPDKKQDSLNVYIKTYPGGINRKTALICILVFKNGLPNALLKFLFILKKLLKAWNLTTVPQMYFMINNPLKGGDLLFFEK